MCGRGLDADMRLPATLTVSVVGRREGQVNAEHRVKLDEHTCGRMLRQHGCRLLLGGGRAHCWWMVGCDGLGTREEGQRWSLRRTEGAGTAEGLALRDSGENVTGSTDSAPA